jgi:hypothetical protein
MAMLVYLFYALISSLMGGKNIANEAHIGGLLAGGIHMTLLRPNVGASWRARNRRISFVAVLMMLTGTIGFARLPIPLVPVEEDGLVAGRPPWWTVGWSATGDRAWASPVEGGLLVVRTTHADEPQSVQAASDAVLATYRALDPLAVVRDTGDVTKDGVPGRRIRIAYEHEGINRRVDAEVFTRGRYTHEVLLDVPGGSGRVAHLWSRIFDGVHLPVPKEVAEARAVAGGWRGLLRQAEGDTDIGDAAAAREKIAAARAEAPQEPAPMTAALQLEAEYPSAGAGPLADEALAAFPDDRKILAAAAHALVAAGRADDARARVAARLADSPGDRRLTALLEELR